MTTRFPICLALSPLLFVIGCALTSKSEPSAPRYFSPERVVDVAGVAPSPSGPIAELRLGRVTAASHLDERLIYRDSEYELGFYQERRWTEPPEHYLKRRLARVLFEERGIHRVVGGAAATIEIELVAFEEIRLPKRIARVQVIARLQDQRVVRWEETLTVDQPMAPAPKGDGPEGMVDALGVALRTVVDRIAARVTIELAKAPVAPESPSPRRR